MVREKRRKKEKKFVLFEHENDDEGEQKPEDIEEDISFFYCTCWSLRAIDMPSRKEVEGACYRAGRLTFILV